MAAHSSILVWRIPCKEEPVGLQPWGLKESGRTEQLTFLLSFILPLGQGVQNHYQDMLLYFFFFFFYYFVFSLK